MGETWRRDSTETNSLRLTPAICAATSWLTRPTSYHFAAAHVACESGPEYRVLNWLERSPEVSWYQEQPVAVPYSFGGRNRVYYSDVAVWDRQGRVVVVEIKPLFTMYRQDTIVKAGMRAIGRPAGPVRTPLTDLDAGEMDALTKLIAGRS